MRRPLTAALLALTAATGLASAALAQPPGPPPPGHDPFDWRGPPPPPYHGWHGPHGRWMGHVHACRARFGDRYDPRDNLVYAGRHPHPCNL